MGKFSGLEFLLFNTKSRALSILPEINSYHRWSKKPKNIKTRRKIKLIKIRSSPRSSQKRILFLGRSKSTRGKKVARRQKNHIVNTTKKRRKQRREKGGKGGKNRRSKGSTHQDEEQDKPQGGRKQGRDVREGRRPRKEERRGGKGKEGGVHPDKREKMKCEEEEDGKMRGLHVCT